MPANILNLPSYRVIKVDETEHDYHVRAEPAQPQAICRHCGCDRLIAWGTREQVFKDLPMHGKRVGLYIDTQRYRCQSCQRTFFQTLPDLAENRMMTDRLVRWLGPQSLKRTFASLAEETGVVEGTIRNIFRDYVNELEKTVRFEVPRWMGIDEIHLIQPRCVISNIQNNTIVDMLHNRNKDTVAKYLFKMPERDKVQYVAMDMWNPYRDAVETVLPGAMIVIDKFHVVRMANDAIERVRKGLREELSLKQKRGLMHDRFVLLKRERDLTDQDRLKLSGWVLNYPALGEAYRLKEGFYGIYEHAKSPDEALQLLAAWHGQITDEVRPYFVDLVRAVTNWQPYILNYFTHPITNAYTESLNGLIRVLSRVGRGYSWEALRAKILFTEGIHRHKQVRPKFERQERKREPEPEAETIGFAYMARAFPPPPPKLRQPDQQAEPKVPKNYGVDIATLTRMLEAGEL